MDWFRLDVDFHRQVGIDDLSAALGVDDFAARGIVVSFWSVVAESFERGDLSGVPARQIAKLMGWRGDAEKLLGALESSGYVRAQDGVVTAGYWDGKVTKSLADRERKAAKRAAEKASVEVTAAPVRGQSSERPRTVLGTSAERRGPSAPTSQDTTGQDTTASQQAGLHPDGNGAGWPAAWEQGDADGTVSLENRERFERVWRASGDAPLTREAVAAVAPEFAADQELAERKLGAMLRSPKRRENPVAYFLASIKRAKRDVAAEASVTAGRAAKIARLPDGDGIAKAHAATWRAGSRPGAWETCPCGACEKGRAEPVAASGGTEDAEAAQTGDRARAATG